MLKLFGLGRIKFIFEYLILVVFSFPLNVICHAILDLNIEYEKDITATINKYDSKFIKLYIGG